MVPVTNEPTPWLAQVQAARSDMSGLKLDQLRAFLAGTYKSGSGANKKLAVHYKLWTRVVLPEAEAKAHLEICQMSEELARLAASLEIGPDGETPQTLGGDAGARGAPTEDVSPSVLKPRLQRTPGATFRSEIRPRRPE